MELNTTEAQFLHKLLIENNLQKYFDSRARGIEDEAFTEEIPRQVFAHIKSHVERYNSLPTIQTVQQEIPSFTPGNVTDRFELYRDNFIAQYERRKLAEFSVALAQKVNNHEQNIIEFVGSTYQELIKGARLSDFGSFREMEDRIREYERKAASGTPAMGVPTGIGPLDEHFLGFRPGDYGVISGRPGEGKTTVALFMAFSAFMAGHKVSYITLEMPREQLFEKLDALATGISINLIKRMNLTDEQLALYRAKAQEVGGLNSDIRIHDRTGECTPVTVEAILTQDEPDILFVDPIYLMKTNGKKNQWEGVKENSNKLKQLAMKYRRPVVVLSQINRGAEESMKHGEQLSVADLSYADALGQDADHVFVLSGNARTRHYHAKRLTSVKLRGASEKDVAIKWDPTTNFIEYLMDYKQLPPVDRSTEEIREAQEAFMASQNNAALA